jgi:hypothetical protein
MRRGQERRPDGRQDADCRRSEPCGRDDAPTAPGSVERCVERAKLAMRDSDFTERVAIYPGPDETVLYGQHGGYRAQLYCTAGAPGIRVEVKGFDPAQTERYKESIIKRF